MNWVGGSRKRIILNKEKRKQKEFFEKEKLKSKMKLLGVSPLKKSAVSLDLLNLYVVNQISTRKDNTDDIRKPVHVEINRGIKYPLRKHNVELPKSPECRRSKSFSDDIQLRVQQEVLENRRKYLLEKESIKAQSLQTSQLANTKCEDPWLSKPPYRQNNLEGHTGLYFQQMNSPECGSMFGKSPKFTTDATFESNHREDPFVGIVTDPMKNTHGETSHPITALFEEKNQPFLTLPSSQSCHSFAKKNIIDQLFTDSGDAHQIPNLHSPYRDEIQQTACSVQRQSAERDLKGIFTAPEQILFSNSQSLNAVDQETAKTQMKDCYLEERNCEIFTDQQENTKDFENTGRFEKQMKNMNVAETIENYFQKRREDVLADSNLNHLQIFGLEETEKACCNYYDEYSNQGEQKGYESSLSSQSPSYSPKPAERYISTTSDESDKKEQDDKALCIFEDTFPRSHGNSLSGNQRAQCSRQSMHMYSVFHESASRETLDIDHQTKPDMDLRKDMSHQTGKDLLGVSFENQYVNVNPRRNAWSQTELYGTDGIKKCDAAIQCNIMQACSCKNVLSSVHSAEIVSSTSKAETTGGQSIPADRAALASPSC
ncbi:regulator of DNA class I crossover intermediates 1 [Anolis sagrei]|uniref:regulator of DNA class I crossover intermediates 1 n=1 Tax=Anolis sagrei TaxID=38937 RepID=UPI003520A657